MSDTSAMAQYDGTADEYGTPINSVNRGEGENAVPVLFALWVIRTHLGFYLEVWNADHDTTYFILNGRHLEPVKGPKPRFDVAAERWFRRLPSSGDPEVPHHLLVTRDSGGRLFARFDDEAAVVCEPGSILSGLR